MSFLVTGCGRSGTKWASRALTDLGLPCPHEGNWTHRGAKGAPDETDSSWCAIPFLPTIPGSVMLIRMIRDPVEVAASIAAERFLTHEPPAGNELWGQFVARWRPDIWEDSDELGMAIRYAADWDTPIEQYPHQPLHTGDPHSLAAAVAHLRGAPGVTPELIERAIAVCASLRRVNHGKGRGTDPFRPSRDTVLAHPEAWRLTDRVARLAKQYPRD